SSPPVVRVQLSALLPARHASPQPPVGPVRSQRRAQSLQAQLRRPLRFSACVHVSWALGRRVRRALLPSSLSRDALAVAVGAVPAESTAPKISQSHCASAACRPATAGTLHPVSSCTPDAPA